MAVTSSSDTISYAMTLMATEASTGFFACLPESKPDLAETLAHLDRRPLDTFLYRYALGLVGRLPLDRAQALKNAQQSLSALLKTLLYEAARQYPQLSALCESIGPVETARLAKSSPLIDLRALSQPDHSIHAHWNRLLAANLSDHTLLPEPDRAPRPFPYPAQAVTDPGGVYITQIMAQRANLPPEPLSPRPSCEETAAVALEKLNALDILEGTEMRHEASLSPFGLLHKWRLGLKVDCGRHRYTLTGLQTAYGRGLTLADARASYAMEIVERCSSFANIGSNRILGYTREHRIFHGSRSVLAEKYAIIDPNAFGADVPYNDEPLHWIKGVRRSATGDETVLVPVQSVFLFTNLDEIDLYAGHGSTGLASGNTVAEAKLSALMELVERDGEATHPFHHSLCFQVEARDAQVASLLEDYRGRGIQFQFQDISPPYGIPCCKCFVTDMDGRVAKGTAASLNGRRAVLSALTETPYPYPYGPPSGPGLLQLPCLDFEDLPDYSTGNADADLSMVEELLIANDLAPVYIDLTREDIRLPVVRALLPGFALTADLDVSCRVHPRLFGNYLKLFGGEAPA